MSDSLIRRLIVFLIITGALASITAAPADARDFYVRQSGRDSNDGLSPRRAWKTLERVFQERFAPGDIVYVGGGTYDVEQVTATPNGSDSTSSTDRDQNDRGNSDRNRRNDRNNGWGGRDRNTNRNRDRDRWSRGGSSRGSSTNRDQGGQSRSGSGNSRWSGITQRINNNRGLDRNNSRGWLGRIDWSRFGRRDNSGRDTTSRREDSDTETLNGYSSVTLIGDSTGRFTGDRGRVVLTSQDGDWCLVFKNYGTVTLDGFSFESSSRQRGSGVAVTGAGCRLNVSNCSFSGLATGVFVQQSEVVIQQSSFDSVTTGLASDQAQLCDVRECQFTRTGGWAINADSQLTTIEQALFTGHNGVRIGAHASPLPIINELGLPTIDSGSLITQRDVAMANVTATDTQYGVLASDINILAVSKLQTDGCTEWGLHATGSDISVSDSTIESGTNGVCLKGTEADQLASIADTTVSGNSMYGLLLNGVGIDFDNSSNVTSRDNGSFGLGVVGADLTLTDAAGFVLSGNGYGIYSTQGDLNVSGLVLADNGYGIRQEGGQLICRNVTITGSGTGLQQVNGTRCTVDRTTIRGARDWGIHLTNDASSTAIIDLREVNVTSGGNGIYASLLASNRLTLTDSELSGNSGYGLLSLRATTQLQNATVTSNRTGIQHTDGPLSILDSVVSQNSELGLSVTGENVSASASLTARRNRLTSNQRAISAWKVNSATLLNNLVTGNSYGLLTQTTAGLADIWNNTLVDNAIGIYHGGGRAIVRNNIVVYGDGTATERNAIGICNSGTGTIVHGSNLLYGQATRYHGTAPGIGDVVKPPRFTNYAGGDFRLAKGSPAINAGTATGGLITQDLVGVSRPMFDAFEIGAYEYAAKEGSVRIINWKEKATAPEQLQ